VPDARVTLAQAYIQAKNFDAARSELQTVLTIQPSNSTAQQPSRRACPRSKFIRASTAAHNP
jgi:Tfp pilus assembly protein PilF